TTEQVGKPARERKIVPARDLVRADHPLPGVIDRTAEADTDTGDLAAIHPGPGQQFRDGDGDLAADALGTRGDIDPTAPQARPGAPSPPPRHGRAGVPSRGPRRGCILVPPISMPR